MLTWTIDQYGDWIAGIIINGQHEYSVYQLRPGSWRCLWAGDKSRSLGTSHTADEGKLICQRHELKKTEPRVVRVRRLCCDSPKVEGGPHVAGCRYALTEASL